MMHWRSRMMQTLIALLLCACSASSGPTLATKTAEGEVRVVVQSVSTADHLNTQGVVVNGEAIINSGSHIQSANLGCLVLWEKGTQSLRPYVDSVASVMTEKFPTDRDGVVRAKLYWIFPGEKLAEFNTRDLTVSFDQYRGPCLKIAP